MRWRFADSIDSFESWVSITGRKGVSLEEYSLLERFGRQGVLPESLVLESCVHFARWLVAASSQWRESCLLRGVEDFRHDSEARLGDNLRIVLEVNHHAKASVVVQCVVRADERLIACGELSLDCVALDTLQDSESLHQMWRELYGQA